MKTGFFVPAGLENVCQGQTGTKMSEPRSECSVGGNGLCSLLPFVASTQYHRVLCGAVGSLLPKFLSQN